MLFRGLNDLISSSPQDIRVKGKNAHFKRHLSNLNSGLWE
jgi:hypothetical protein